MFLFFVGVGVSISLSVGSFFVVHCILILFLIFFFELEY